MAKPTIKGLQEQLDLYRETIDLITKDNSRLNKEIENIKNSIGVVSKKEFDTLLSDFKNMELQRDEWKKLYFHEREKEKTLIVKNSRNAGRKPIEEKLKNKALALKEQGLSIRNIAKELNIAVGTVHKIINEPSNLDNKQPMTEEEYN